MTGFRFGRTFIKAMSEFVFLLTLLTINKCPMKCSSFFSLALTLSSQSHSLLPSLLTLSVILRHIFLLSPRNVISLTFFEKLVSPKKNSATSVTKMKKNSNFKSMLQQSHKNHFWGPENWWFLCNMAPEQHKSPWVFIKMISVRMKLAPLKYCWSYDKTRSI